MKTLNPKRILIWIAEFLFTEILSILLQKFCTGYFVNTHIKIIIDNAIILGTFSGIIILIITYAIWYVRDMKKRLEYMLVVQKYFNVILVKFEASNSSHPALVFEDDLRAFTPEQKKILNAYLNNKESLRIFMKGTNKVFGQFM